MSEAPVQRESGERRHRGGRQTAMRRILRLERRAAHLRVRVAETVGDYDKAELSALDWAIPILREHVESRPSLPPAGPDLSAVAEEFLRAISGIDAQRFADESDWYMERWRVGQEVLERHFGARRMP